MKEVKGMFLYSAVSNFTPWQTCSFRQQLQFSGKHSAMPQLLHRVYPLTLPTLSMNRYSFIQQSELGHFEENENALASFETAAKDFQTQALSIESLVFYR